MTDGKPPVLVHPTAATLYFSGLFFKPTASLRFFEHWSSWPEHQRISLPFWIYTRDQQRAGEKEDMTRAVIRTLVEHSEGIR